MNAIATAAPPLAYGDLERLADSIAKSGLFGIKTKEQAIVLMMISHAEGRHPALAARDFDIINGRPAKKAEAMMRDFVQAGGRVEWHTLTDELADATFTHPQTGSVRIDWDMKRAFTAFGKKDMYSKFPRQMLRSRVVSEGVRTLWPLATSGMYVPEETADIPPAANEMAHNGPTLDHEPEAPPQRADMPRAPRNSEPSPKPRTPREFLEKLDIDTLNAQSDQEANRLICSEDVLRAKEVFTGEAKTRLAAIITRTLQTWYHEAPSDEPADEELPEVEIVGQDKMAAG